MTKSLQFITDVDHSMTTLQSALIDDGLDMGLRALSYTHGLTVDPDVRYDVAAVAVSRLLDCLPASVTIDEVRARLLVRAVTLDARRKAGRR